VKILYCVFSILKVHQWFPCHFVCPIPLPFYLVQDLSPSAVLGVHYLLYFILGSLPSMVSGGARMYQGCMAHSGLWYRVSNTSLKMG
jgi:hypothetical protein